MTVTPLKAVFCSIILLAICPGAKSQDLSAIEDNAREIVSRMTLEEKISYIGGDTDGFGIRPIERLGLRAIRMADGPQGVRNNTESTQYPCGIALAAAWDEDLAYEYGEAIGNDAKARGIDIMLGPGVNIYRSPLCGRNFEYFGEDPYLTSRTAVGYIRGLQSRGVMATVKHFCANNQEWSRHNASSDIDERTLNEIYLPAFKTAVTEANVAAVMSSYNLLNSVHTSENEYLATELLRNKWGFDGIYMSDWAATYSGVAAANAGLDLEMPYGKFMNAECLKSAIENGIVEESKIDEKCVHIITKILEFGMNKKTVDNNLPLDNPESDRVALDVARSSIVLLKNMDNTLPLNFKKIKKIAVEGPMADIPAAGGGSGNVTPIHYTSIKQGISNISKKTRLADSDVAEYVVYCAGFGKELEQEGRDRKFNLPEEQTRRICELCEAGKKVILVIFAGGGIDFCELPENVSAILMAWYPGQEGGKAVAELISGSISPSGKLPASFENRLEDNPSWGSYYANEEKNLKSPYDRIRYKEGVFIGYRGYDRKDTKALYPFGYGLSYTDFEFSELETSIEKGYVNVSFTIRNIGKKDGSEVAQIYVGEISPSVPRPIKELKGFKKVFIKVGKSERVSIKLGPEAFEFYDVGSHSFKSNKGDYTIYVGNSSVNLPLMKIISR